MPSSWSAIRSPKSRTASASRRTTPSSATSSTTSSRSPTRTARGPTRGTAPPARSPARRLPSRRRSTATDPSPAAGTAQRAPRPPRPDDRERRSMSLVTDNFPLLRDAFLTTLSLAVVSGLVALAFGTILAAMRVGPIRPLRAFATGYVEVFRNTPLTVVFFFLAFGIVEIGLQFPTRYLTAVAALSLYTASFVCEALRSGINAVPPGQAEAARALGLDFRQSLTTVVLPQAFRTVVPPGQAEAARALGLDFRQSLTTVVLPQAFRTVVPPLGNVWIALAKNTSIAAGFAVTDLTATLQRLANANADQLAAVFAAIVAAYLLITLPSAWVIRLVEKRVAIIR